MAGPQKSEDALGGNMKRDLEIRWRSIQEKVLRSCKRSQRDPAAVTLVAVSKKQPIELIRKAYDLGIRDFGENYVQELVEKRAALPSDIRWHFIGPLQTNKIKLLGEVALVHSIDRLSLAEELHRKRLGLVPQDVLIQVNISNEETKHGFILDQLREGVEAISRLQGLRVRGLMTMPPPASVPEDNRKYFQQLRSASDLLGQYLQKPVVLSMGMSDDFEVAIEEGATHIRVGTLLFGERPSPA
jgi:pyridoxal phosphate enzyme (YggS family)